MGDILNSGIWARSFETVRQQYIRGRDYLHDGRAVNKCSPHDSRAD